MKNLFASSVTMLCLIVLCSFASKDTNSFTGTYGVSSSDPSAIELKINDDHTFTYQDLSDAENPINIQGNWEENRNFILLTASNSEIDFHDKWKITNDGDAAKSRKGICFYTLHKL